MTAALIRRSKTVLPDGSILEIVIWKLPRPVSGSRHLYKYRLYFGRNNLRIVGYDNERGKGDHRHVDGEESLYAFVSVETLVADFLTQVRERLTR